MAKKNEKTSIMLRLKKKVNGKVENFFYWYGMLIARNPWKVVLYCLLFVAICGIGFFRFRQEKNPFKLWVPQDSDFRRDTDWIMAAYKEGYRDQHFLITAPNVLEPKVILQMEKIRKKVISMSVNNMTYEDVCFRIPSVKPGSVGLFDMLGRRRKRSFFFFGRGEDSNMGGLEFDPSLYLSTSSYCKIVNKLPKLCIEMNLAELWSNDEDVISKLTLNDVIQKLNTTRASPVTGHAIEFQELLGGVEKDRDGKIIGAQSMLSIWMTHVNFSLVNMDEAGNDAGTGDWATVPILNWEAGYLKLLQNETHANVDKNVTYYYSAGRSFGDVSGKSMFQDIGKLFIGSFIMFVFIQLVLPSKFNRIDMKLWLGSLGLFCIVLSFVAAVGLCSMFNIPYGPVHTSLPFLMLGIGVDDIFVVTSCWHNLSPSESRLSLDKQIAVALRNAGLSITITSLTDTVAFLVGSFTILPCLQSFCLYAAAGMFVMYIFQVTIYVAFMTLDAKRVIQNRNCILWCYKHKDFKESSDTSETFQSKMIGVVFDKFIFTKPIMILVIVMTVGFAGFGIKGDLNLTQRFEPEWFLPNDSYILKFITQRKMYYPDLGMDGGIFMGKFNYTEEFRNVHNLSLSIASETNILKLVDSWTHGFIRYTKSAEKIDILEQEIGDDDFHRLLASYLWSPSGARFQKNFRFTEKLECGKPTPPIEMTSFDFIFRTFSGPEEYLPAMNKLKSLVHDSRLPNSTAWAKIFGNWVTDEVIDKELFRNLLMAMGCVMFCTAILIIDLQICFWIFICVLLTLIDVAGFMYFWGLYIDIASCIALVLAVGLCVDFAAHIGHTFLRLPGSRRERATKTVKFIGTATFQGAFSTLLALSLLGFSDAYIFTTFFKIFLLVILFGIFHGLVFLPVILCLVGPVSYNELSSECPEDKNLSILHSKSTTDEREHLNQDLINGLTISN